MGEIQNRGGLRPPPLSWAPSLRLIPSLFTPCLELFPLWRNCFRVLELSPLFGNLFPFGTCSPLELFGSSWGSLLDYCSINILVSFGPRFFWRTLGLCKLQRPPFSALGALGGQKRCHSALKTEPRRPILGPKHGAWSRLRFWFWPILGWFWVANVAAKG